MAWPDVVNSALNVLQAVALAIVAAYVALKRGTGPEGREGPPGPAGDALEGELVEGVVS